MPACTHACIHACRGTTDLSKGLVGQVQVGVGLAAAPLLVAVAGAGVCVCMQGRSGGGGGFDEAHAGGSRSHAGISRCMHAACMQRTAMHDACQTTMHAAMRAPHDAIIHPRHPPVIMTTTSMSVRHCVERGSSMRGHGPSALRTTVGRHLTAKQRPQMLPCSACTSGHAAAWVGGEGGFGAWVGGSLAGCAFPRASASAAPVRADVIPKAALTNIFRDVAPEEA
jgi:hypothetical protein